jgi:hypothetical protein
MKTCSDIAALNSKVADIHENRNENGLRIVAIMIKNW